MSGASTNFVNLDFNVGETFEMPIEWSTPNELDPNVLDPVNLTSVTARMDFLPEYGAAAALSLTTAGGGIVIDPLLGLVTFSLSQANIALLPKTGVYDLKLTFLSGRTKRLIEGAFTTHRAATP